MAHLRTLQVLDVHSTSLSQLPDYVQELPKLLWVNLEGNRLRTLGGISLTEAPYVAWSKNATLRAKLELQQRLILLGHNPVCNTTTHSFGVDAGQWHIKCMPECGLGCASTTWPHGSTRNAAVTFDWRGDGSCEVACDVPSCQGDQGDCLQT